MRRSKHSNGVPLWAVWLSGLLLMSAGMSRHLVFCTHHDGDSHIEFAHTEGCTLGEHACCAHSHGHSHSHDHGEPGGHDGEDGDPHGSCTHVDLTIDVAPTPTPDNPALPGGCQHWLPPTCWIAVPCWPTVERTARPPPATGPPRPRAFLAHRASTLLLL